MMTGTSGRAALALGNSSRPVIPGMLMSDRMRINDAPAASLMQLKGTVSRLRKIHREASVADVASELLAKQRLNIGFVVNNKNKQAHLSAPALLVAVMRGRMTRLLNRLCFRLIAKCLAVGIPRRV